MAPLLAADLVDFLKALVPIVILIIWVLSQVFAAQAKQAAPGRPRRPGPPPKGAEPAPDGVAAEIEAFLRRVRDQRGEQQMADVEVLEPAPPPQRAQRQPSAPKKVAVEAVDQVIEATPVGREVADPAARRLGADRLAARAERLGSAVRMADRQAEQRLHATFDHEIGQLERAAAPPAAGAAEQATGSVPIAASPASLTGLLRSRAGIRQAIILNEILSRPEQRW